MEILFPGIIAFLLLLAVFDLSVGVSNDAVNFLNSAVGSRAASFRRILLVAAVGIFLGAVMSHGMMDIARHGIFRPEHFSFYELLCIFMAVMVTDILLLDVFNTLGMPTSTTVSMVFELLGATFGLSVLKLAHDSTGLAFHDLLNTEKALQVIIGIFLSVAIAFVFGTVVQFLARLVFSFRYTRGLTPKIGLFGGVATTSILYFLLLKGVKGMTWMTPALSAWLEAHTFYLLAGCFVVSTLIMQLLHALRVNVFKVVVLMGTFSLAMAFAGNDLVNFIGVPLTGLASYQDYLAHGAGSPDTFLMDSLNAPAHTPVGFLLAAGVIMVVALATSRKAHRVIRTEVGLGSQQGGDELFGSSRIARRLVRLTLSAVRGVHHIVPLPVRQWVNSRFRTDEAILEDGASFDLIRGSVNLTLAAMLIALGTSLQLPLSTTYVTFMVAMGSSLADRAWGRETAVFRITGVISVIGGWFITAGVAFIGAGLLVMVLHAGGPVALVVLGVLALVLLVHRNLRDHRQTVADRRDTLLQTLLAAKDKTDVWHLLQEYLVEQQTAFLRLARQYYLSLADGFLSEDAKPLDRTLRAVLKEKSQLKNTRRKETLCFQRVERSVAMAQSAWFHAANNGCMAMLYNLRRISETCLEHVENNFHPLPTPYAVRFLPLRDRVEALLRQAVGVLERVPASLPELPLLRKQCDELKESLSAESNRVMKGIQEGEAEWLSVLYVYLNLLQETREMISALRKLLRACGKLQGR